MANKEYLLEKLTQSTSIETVNWCKLPERQGINWLSLYILLLRFEYIFTFRIKTVS